MYKTISWNEICINKITKEELANLIGLNEVTFDYALPQQWLDDFVDRNNIPYETVRTTTFYVYDKSIFGYPVSGCTEINDIIKGELNGK